jgi:hypothetical protein
MGKLMYGHTCARYLQNSDVRPATLQCLCLVRDEVSRILLPSRCRDGNEAQGIVYENGHLWKMHNMHNMS